MSKTGITDVPKAERLLSEIIEKYKEVIQNKLVEIILFGSYARKNQEEYSDFDIMVIIDDSVENIKSFDRALEDINFELTMKYEILVSPIMVKFSTFKEYGDSLPFYMNVMKEGVIVYERTAA